MVRYGSNQDENKDEKKVLYESIKSHFSKIGAWVGYSSKQLNYNDTGLLKTNTMV